ncbi:MAG: hypothetical protein HC839_04330 [Leptolyngbyaceae cyanobacterium RM2_2_21]|nr:hypothetical protein [Leptolyngbyaceae cyanobacterium RM2_2_21]
MQNVAEYDLSDNSALFGIPLHSDCEVDYAPLRQALSEQDFQQADTLTRQLLCQAASYPTGAGAATRGWLYFTEVRRIPVADLQTIDRLWRAGSQDRFGFSVQRRIWSMVPATSVVSVLVIVCTEIGASPPTSTRPTRIWRL